MSGLPWIKVATDLPHHPKSRALAKLLRDTRAWTWPVRLWLHSAAFNAEGRFRDAAEVEDACDWSGKRGELAAALVAVGFLDRRGRGFAIHGWEEWALPHVDRLRRDRERKRRERAAMASAGRPQDIPGMSKGVRAVDGEERRGEESESQTAPQSPPPVPSDGRLAGDDELREFRERLARDLGVPRIHVGKDREGVLRFFREQLEAHGEESIVADCLEAARRSKNGTPSSLAFFVGWLERLPGGAGDGGRDATQGPT